MGQKQRKQGAQIITELLETAVQKKNKKIISSDWLPDLEFEPAKVNSESYMLVVSLSGKETIDMGFSINDLEGIPTDAYLRHNTEKYIDELVSRL